MAKSKDDGPIKGPDVYIGGDKGKGKKVGKSKSRSKSKYKATPMDKARYIAATKVA